MADEKDLKFCLTALELFEHNLRGLAFMAPTAAGEDESYYAHEDALTMRIEDLEKCMPKETHRKLKRHFDKLTSIPFEAENASDIIYELDQMSEIAFKGIKQRFV